MRPFAIVTVLLARGSFAGAQAVPPSELTFVADQPTEIRDADGMPLCVTPCSLGVSPGVHRYQAGTWPFELTAEDGPQTWRVGGGNGAAEAWGLGLLIGGSAVAALGLVFWGLAAGLDTAPGDVVEILGISGMIQVPVGGIIALVGLPLYGMSGGFAMRLDGSSTSGFESGGRELVLGFSPTHGSLSGWALQLRAVL